MRSAPPTFIIEQSYYDCANLKEHFGPIQPTPGWHLLAVEINGEHLRIFVDDVCLGQTRTRQNEAIDGIRCAMETAGKLWIDELTVSRRVPKLARPQSAPDQDSLWLEHGEQIFGKIVSVGADQVVLDAKFGKRTVAWSSLRGILFAQSKQAAAPIETEIVFRPGPGFSLDQMRGKLVRWEKDQLIVEHRLLGEIAVERGRLNELRPVPKQ
jgi:hypothetical protein